MKALILKDFYVLRKQFWLFAFIIIAFQFMMNMSAGFITVLYAALLPATAFSYDDRSKWDVMELMLPYGIRQIVLSRYCVGWCAAAVFMAFGGLSRGIMGWIMPKLYAFPVVWGGGNLRVLLSEFAFALIFLALTMPIYFRFDAEKSRLVRTLTLALLCGVTGAGMAILGIEDIAASYSEGMARRVWALYLAAAALTAVSIPLSMLAWKRRHR